MNAHLDIIFAKQARIMDGFCYRLLDLAGCELGEIQWPMHAQAVNARLKVHADDAAGSVKLRCAQDHYLIQFEYLQRGWQNDTRYILRRGDQILASASLVFKEGLTERGVMFLESPVEARFVRGKHWFRRSFELLGTDGQTFVGRLEEPAIISTLMQLRGELPGMSLPQKAFCLFLGLHLIQT